MAENKIKFAGFDIETKGEGETYGLQPYRVRQGKAHITAVSIVNEEGDILYSTLNPEIEYLAKAMKLIAAQGYTFIGWNTLFDVSWLIAAGLEKVVRTIEWTDGEVMLRCLENTTDESVRFGLKATVAKYLPDFAGYESDVAGDFDTVDEKLLDYNKLDAFLTARLGRIFYEKMSEKFHTLSDIICAGIIPFAGAWNDGIPVDLDAVSIWEVHSKADFDTAFDEIKKLTNTSLMLAPTMPKKLSKKAQALADLNGFQTVTSEILGSHSQLKRFLHSQGLQVAATNKTELTKLSTEPLIAAILDYKEARTAQTKFIAGLKASTAYNESDRTHPSSRLWNTYTGRVGYTSKTLKKYPTGIAIHQFPRKSEARNCIVAPKGFLLAELDFQTQESRLICDFSGDETLHKIFSSGMDIHSFLAAQIMKRDYEEFLLDVTSGSKEAKNERYLGKIGNLSCQYRTGWKRLIDIARTQHKVNLDEPAAKQIHSLYRTTYKRVPEYWNSSIEFAKLHGYAESRGGRRVKIDNWSSGNMWSAESTAINFPIQATGADMKFLAIKTVEPMLHANGGKYMLDLHDALFLLVPDNSKGEELARDIQFILSNLPYEETFGWKPKVNFPVDLKLGKAWGSLTEIK